MTEALVASLLARINRRWDAETCASIAYAEDSFAAYDREIEAAQAAADDIAASFNAALCRIRWHRNCASRANRLPVEVLCIIFRFSSERGAVPKVNAKIASVCKHWRSVALGDNQIWTSIDIGRMNEKYAHVALERCGSLPLDISDSRKHTYTFYNNPPWIYNFVEQHLGRTQTLEVTGVSDYDEVRRFRGAHAPLLTRLLLECVSASDADDTPALLLVDAPKLLSLELRNCYAPWRSGRYRGLTRLQIRVGNAIQTLDISTEDVVVAVCGCPELEDLGLYFADDTIEPSQYTFRPTGQRTDMRNLRSLVMKLPIQFIVHLLSSVVLPSDLETIHLYAYESPSTELIQLLLSPLCLPSTPFANLISLTITDDNESVMISGRRTLQDPPVLVAQISWGEYDHIPPGEFSTILDALRTNYSLCTVRNVMVIRENMDNLCAGICHEGPPLPDSTAEFILHFTTLQSLVLRFVSGCLAATMFEGIARLAPSSLETWSLSRLEILRLSLDLRNPCRAPWTERTVQFLQYVNSHQPLISLDIWSSNLPVRRLGEARHFIDGLRALAVPHMWWSASQFIIGTEETQMCTAGDLWPTDIPYCWGCRCESNHRQGRSTVGRCCRGSNPQTQFER